MDKSATYNDTIAIKDSYKGTDEEYYKDKVENNFIILRLTFLNRQTNTSINYINLNNGRTHNIIRANAVYWRS